jgi:hypothetical protein
MGRGIGLLVAYELGALPDLDALGGAVFASELQRRLVARPEGLDAREHRLNEKERSLRA